MTNKLYDPFLSATRDVFKLMLDLNNVSENKENLQTTDSSIHIKIGVLGDIHGMVVYSFPKETCLEMVKILSGMEFAEIDDFVTSAMSEIANIISGNVMSALSVQDIVCDITTPEILERYSKTECAKDAKICESMQISTDVGVVNLDMMFSA